MQMILGSIAFAGLMALWLLAVIAVHRARLDGFERPPMPAETDTRTKIVWETGV